ncbi:MAG: PadR family transcriptional regulator [Oscillospiraceae bacterium]|nr:PadR family transcriptional regulator [Oscillospiraceae bacterium]
MTNEKEIEKALKTYLPMTETAFYILLSLQTPRHGYGISKHVETLTNGRIKLGSGTIYGTLTKMLRDNVIEVYDDSDKKIIYVYTETGKILLARECERIELLYKDSRVEWLR